MTRRVFGRRTNREVYASYRLNRAGSVAVTVTRGGKLFRRYRPLSRRAGETYRVRLGSERLRRGDYRFRIEVRSGA